MVPLGSIPAPTRREIGMVHGLYGAVRFAAVERADVLLMLTKSGPGAWFDVPWQAVRPALVE